MANPNRAIANLPKKSAFGEISVKHSIAGENLIDLLKASGGKGLLRSRRIGPRNNPTILQNVHLFGLGNLTLEELNEKAANWMNFPVSESEWQTWVLWNDLTNNANGR
jgi:hypothetical protein